MAHTDIEMKQNSRELCPLKPRKFCLNYQLRVCCVVLGFGVFLFVNIQLLKCRTGALPLQIDLGFFSSDAILLRIRVPECLQQPCIFLSVRDKSATVHSYRAVQSLPLAVSL